MPEELLYPVNPNRNDPWNDLPELPIHKKLYRRLSVFEQLGKAKEALALLAGRSIAIPNPGVLINTITLQEAKDSAPLKISLLPMMNSIRHSVMHDQNWRPPDRLKKYSAIGRRYGKDSNT